jgi:phage-related protein
MVKPPYSKQADSLLRPLEWVGPSKSDLKEFPGEVLDHVGFALHQAQTGVKHRDAKPLKGLGAGTLEVVSRHDGETFRAFYTVRFEAAVYVLHAFHKKAKRGIATPKKEIDLVKRRLKAAAEHYEANYGQDEDDVQN